MRERKHIIDNELTDLIGTFNEISKELVKQYENLEERVAEQTKEREEREKVAVSANHLVRTDVLRCLSVMPEIV